MLAQKTQKRLTELTEARMDFGLHRMEAILPTLNLPQASRSWVIAGTNGKGTTALAFEALCLAHGQTVGTFTSPHLYCPTQRIRINGQEISPKAFDDAFWDLDVRLKSAHPNVGLTYFEFFTALAADIFGKRNLDLAIFEVGMGGRLDSTNALPHRWAAVTQIGLDHMEFLGRTLEEIALEKVAVGQGTRQTFLLNQNSAVLETMQTFAKAKGFDSKVVDPMRWLKAQNCQKPFHLPEQLYLNFGLGGQLAEHALMGSGKTIDSNLSQQALDGFRPAARAELFTRGQTHCLLDVAHNPQAMHALAVHLQTLGWYDVDVYFGAMKNKNVLAMVDALKDRTFSLCLVPINHPNAFMDLAMLQKAFPMLKIRAVDSIQDAYQDMVAKSLDRVLVTGSFRAVGPWRQHVLEDASCLLDRFLGS